MIALMKIVDLTGKRIGMLTVIERAGTHPTWGQKMWLCKCDCGGTAIKTSQALNLKKIGHCGCMEASNKGRHMIGNTYGKTHGMARSKAGRSTEYAIWSGMIQRCTNHENPSFANYGGRGVSVCERWLTFENFISDMGSRPKGHSIDRIDVNLGYEPGNCRWATSVTQQNNKRSNLHICLDGRSMTVAEASRLLGIPGRTAYNRVHRAGKLDFTSADLLNPPAKG